MVDKFTTDIFDNRGRVLRPVLTNTKADGSGDWVFAIADDSGTQSIKFGDSSTLDASGRLRVSNPVNEFAIDFQYNLHPLFFEQITANNGTIAHKPAFSAAQLDVTTDNGSKAAMQSYQYFRYQPGKSDKIDMTFILPEKQSGTTMEVGYGDDENAFVFQIKGTVVQMVRRTKASGSVVVNAVTQANWNGDVLDGTGNINNPSGILLDVTKGQILRIDFQWLSQGRIRMCFDIGGNIILAHEFLIANTISETSTTTGNLPIRWLIENTSAPASAKTMFGICASVSTEGGDETETGHPFGFGNGVTTRTVGTTPIPVVSIRPNLTLNSITNRVKFRLDSINILSSNDIHWELIYLPTSITSVSWQAPVAHSSVQTDIAGTAIVGGIDIHHDYVAGASGQSSGTGKVPLTSKLPFTLDAPGTGQTRSLSIVCARVGNSDSQVSASFNWTEVR